MREREVYIAGTGSISPGEPVPFDQIEDVLGHITDAPKKVQKRIERLRPLMKEMLGIEYAHYVIDPATREFTDNNTSLAAKAAKKALEQAKVEAKDIDLIVYAGILYDQMCPPNSVMVQDALNIPYCAEISIHSNCTSIYKAMQVGSDLVANGRYDTALIVSSQISSTFLRSGFFNQKALTIEQAILRWFLCDGAGALVLTSEKPDQPGLKMVDTYLESVGVGIEPSMQVFAELYKAALPEIYDKGLHHLTQDIQVVSKLAPDFFGDGMKAMMEKTQLDISRVKCFFANIPTKHLMDLAVKKLRFKEFKNPDLPVYTRLASKGYQGPPSVVIGLDDYLRAEDTKLQSGDLIASLVTESSKWMHAGFVMEYHC